MFEFGTRIEVIYILPQDFCSIVQHQEVFSIKHFYFSVCFYIIVI